METTQPKKRSPFAKTVSSESFIEKSIFLVVTAVLSGLLIPYLSNEIQRTKAKNEIILQAQGKLLDEVSKTLLTCETLLLDVSFYKLPEASNEEMHKKAYDRYSERIVDLLADWRLESVKARSLASDSASVTLDSFMNKMFSKQDTPINQLYRANAPEDEWVKQHDINMAMLEESKALIYKLAKDMNLTRENMK